MDIHHIHDGPIGIHGGAKGVEHWLAHGLTRDGLRELQQRAEKGEEVHFTNGEGEKFKMQHDKEKGFSVDVSHH